MFSRGTPWGTWGAFGCSPIYAVLDRKPRGAIVDIVDSTGNAGFAADENWSGDLQVVHEAQDIPLVRSAAGVGSGC